VISTANIGRAAVNPAIQASRNGELLAIASREEMRARSFAEAHEIPRYFGSYQALLDDPEIDAVYLPLPNALHAEWAIKAAEAGKHVLCEKPLALDAAECEAMAAAAAAHDVKLMEAFMYRFHPRTEVALANMRQGILGEIRAIRSAFSFRLTRTENIRFSQALGGGALMDVGCYCVSVSRALAGSEPVEVQAWARWTEGYMGGGPQTGVDSELTGILHFADGVRAHFDSALTSARREFYEVVGTDGWLHADRAFLPGTADVTLEGSLGPGRAFVHSVDGADEYQLMVEHFADCIQQGRDPLCSATEAAANMRVIAALYQSARAGGARIPLQMG